MSSCMQVGGQEPQALCKLLTASHSQAQVVLTSKTIFVFKEIRNQNIEMWETWGLNTQCLRHWSTEKMINWDTMVKLIRHWPSALPYPEDKGLIGTSSTALKSYHRHFNISVVLSLFYVHFIYLFGFSILPIFCGILSVSTSLQSKVLNQNLNHLDWRVSIDAVCLCKSFQGSIRQQDRNLGKIQIFFSLQHPWYSSSSKLFQ